jgi:hypothetical protein
VLDPSTSSASDEAIAAERAVTPDQQAQVDKAAERLAKLSAATNPNTEGDDEPSAQEVVARNLEAHPMPVTGGDGKPLAPLAGEGERGCSVCGRKGHRKGGKACLGLDDPAVTNKDVQDYADGKNDRFSSPVKPCAHGAWTRNPITGDWECGECGGPAAAEEATFPGQVEHAVGDKVTVAGVEFVKVSEDPFEDRDEVAAADADWHLFLDRINEAKSKAEIREIRSEATELGVWNDQLLQAGLARIKAL